MRRADATKHTVHRDTQLTVTVHFSSCHGRTANLSFSEVTMHTIFALQTMHMNVCTTPDTLDQSGGDHFLIAADTSSHILRRCESISSQQTLLEASLEWKGQAKSIMTDGLLDNSFGSMRTSVCSHAGTI